MQIDAQAARQTLLAGLNPQQRQAVSSTKRRLIVIAGAGSGKTEVMARRVAWWVAVKAIPKDRIVAFTFTDAAAEELKFRIRESLQSVTADDEDSNLGGMFIGTIHAFCLRALRDFAPAAYYMHDVLDEPGRISLLQRGYWDILGLDAVHAAASAVDLTSGRMQADKLFRDGYDQLNEHGLLDVELSTEPMPTDVRLERYWCLDATLRTEVGTSDLATVFADSAARYYAYLRVRRFFDFPTVQSELIRRLQKDQSFADAFHSRWTHLVVDEVQDVNPVQDDIVRQIVGQDGHLTAVGDHRQAIYAFRGGRVDLMGKLSQEITDEEDGETVDLPKNYRSTPRIIDIANEWSRTIQDRAGMTNPAMSHGLATRTDTAPEHVALLRFPHRQEEAAWIAATIAAMVDPLNECGAFQDDREGPRGLSHSDIAILVRSSTDVRSYQDALRARGIPAVVRGGPDLFSQPESLLVVSALAIAANVDAFYGNEDRHGSLPNRIRTALGSTGSPETVLRAAARAMQDRGIDLSDLHVRRLLTLAKAIRRRTRQDRGIDLTSDEVACTGARRWLASNRPLRRVFPQQIFHWIIEEAGLAEWGVSPIAESARFHVGQISRLVKGIEASGWTHPSSFKWQVIALLNWGAERARSEEAPLLVSPNAVTVTTIHSAKGLQFPAVFVADVCARRFPSNQARRAPKMPFERGAVPEIDPSKLADNENYDDERRLMYVAITRAERYLYVSASGAQRSQFLGRLQTIFPNHGGIVAEGGIDVAHTIQMAPIAPDSTAPFATSFSDLRYFAECPHDFYMRIVLGFTPTIGQEFGYGRGIHNLLRAVHEDPAGWADLAKDPAALETEVTGLLDDGMFYLRYTTGAPLDNLRSKAIQGVRDYIVKYADELASLEFHPEKEFETLIEEQKLLVSGAIDVVRLDDPPRVTIIDFKSGDSRRANASGLTEELMAMQIGVYGVAAKRELEYEPRSGLIRYIGEDDPERAERIVDLGDGELKVVREQLIDLAQRIRRRRFDDGPTPIPGVSSRCRHCDFRTICRRSTARS